MCKPTPTSDSHNREHMRNTEHCMALGMIIQPAQHTDTHTPKAINSHDTGAYSLLSCPVLGPRPSQKHNTLPALRQKSTFTHMLHTTHTQLGRQDRLAPFKCKEQALCNTSSRSRTSLLHESSGPMPRRTSTFSVPAAFRSILQAGVK